MSLRRPALRDRRPDLGELAERRFATAGHLGQRRRRRQSRHERRRRLVDSQPGPGHERIEVACVRLHRAAQRLRAREHRRPRPSPPPCRPRPAHSSTPSAPPHRVRSVARPTPPACPAAGRSPPARRRAHSSRRRRSATAAVRSFAASRAASLQEERGVGDARQRRRPGRRLVDHLPARVGQREERAGEIAAVHRGDVPRLEGTAVAGCRTNCRDARDDARAPSPCAASPRSDPPRRASPPIRSRAPPRPRAGTARCWSATCAAATTGCGVSWKLSGGSDAALRRHERREVFPRAAGDEAQRARFVRRQRRGARRRARPAHPARDGGREPPQHQDRQRHRPRGRVATTPPPPPRSPRARRRRPCGDRTPRPCAARATSACTIVSTPASGRASRYRRPSVRTTASAISHAWYAIVVSVSAIWPTAIAEVAARPRADGSAWRCPERAGHTPANAGSSGGTATTVRTNAVQSAGDDPGHAHPQHQREERRRHRQRAPEIVDHLPAPDRRQALAQDPRQQLPVPARPAMLACRGRQIVRRRALEQLDVGHQARRARTAPSNRSWLSSVLSGTRPASAASNASMS